MTVPAQRTSGDTWTVAVPSVAELELLLRFARLDGWTVRSAVVHGGSVHVTLRR